MLYPLSYEGLGCEGAGQGGEATLRTSTRVPAVPQAATTERLEACDGRPIVARLLLGTRTVRLWMVR